MNFQTQNFFPESLRVRFIQKNKKFALFTRYVYYYLRIIFNVLYPGNSLNGKIKQKFIIQKENVQLLSNKPSSQCNLYETHSITDPSDPKHPPLYHLSHSEKAPP